MGPRTAIGRFASNSAENAWCASGCSYATTPAMATTAATNNLIFMIHLVVNFIKLTCPDLPRPRLPALWGGSDHHQVAPSSVLINRQHSQLSWRARAIHTFALFLWMSYR